jgi:hypothetical protein
MAAELQVPSILLPLHVDVIPHAIISRNRLLTFPLPCSSVLSLRNFPLKAPQHPSTTTVHSNACCRFCLFAFLLTPSFSAACELLLLLLHVAQWDVCCDGDENAAALQSEAQSQLLFQGLGSCLGFMNEERLSFPRVRPATILSATFISALDPSSFSPEF